ncbi:MAG TPA: GAF domain-containing protein [Anaeromyxobacteraceae bacterium]|nr:GAF domain-containing protein [Anaeromyxobacteraceae bacterium]
MLQRSKNVVPSAEPARRADLFEAVLDAVPAAVALLRGPELVFELVNPRLVALASSAPLVGKTLAEVWPEAAPSVVPILRNVLATGEHYLGTDLRLPLRRAAGLAPEDAWFTIELQRIAGGVADPDAVLASIIETTSSVRSRRSAEEAADAAARAMKRAQLLADLAADLNQGVDLPSVLETTLLRVHDMLHAEDGSVYMLDPERRTIRGAAERRPLGRVALEVPLDGLANVARAVDRREPVYFTRAETRGFETEWFERNAISASFALPLVANDRCIGVLFLNEYGESSPPTSDDLAFARGVAAHCAVAVTRAMAFEAEREARARAERAEAAARRIAQRLAISQDLTAELSSAHEIAQVFQVIAAKGRAAVAASTASVMLLRGANLELVGAVGHPDDAVAESRVMPLDAQTPTADVARTGQPIIASASAEVRRRWPALGPMSRGLGEGAWVCLPLVTDGEVRGVMGFGFAEEREFDLEERAFLGWISRKCAQALDRARLFEAERQAREEAERIGKLQEQLLAVVGHDLRTPLSAISMAVSLLFRRGGLDEKQAQTLTRVASASQRMAGIIRDLLDFSRARQGAGMPMVSGPLDLREVTERALLELQSAHPQRELRLRVSGDVHGEGDPARIAQVISNLAANAIQHGAEDAPVDVVLEGTRDELRISIHNDGPPIPPELQPAMFEPFRRGERRADDGSSSSVGLGLFIVREIVRAHGGSIEVSSAAGEGTTFTARLPRR